MAKITKDAILKTADLARLSITDDEAKMYSAHVSTLLTFAEKINEINTDGVEPTTNGIALTNVLRKDEPRQLITREEALNNAEEVEDNQFKVLSIME